MIVTSHGKKTQAITAMTRKINQFWQTKNSECFSCAAPTLENSSAWREVQQVNPRARAKWNRNEFADVKWLHFMARNVRPKRKGRIGTSSKWHSQVTQGLKGLQSQKIRMLKRCSNSVNVRQSFVFQLKARGLLKIVTGCSAAWIRFTTSPIATVQSCSRTS